MTGPVDPVEDVEPPVGAQREEVVAGDGLRLSGLAHHEQLEKINILSTITESHPFRADPDPAFKTRRMTGVKGLVTQYARTDIIKHSSQQCSGSGSVRYVGRIYFVRNKKKIYENLNFCCLVTSYNIQKVR
jgi:hypothetical protein